MENRPSLLIIIITVIVLLAAGYFALTKTVSRISSPAKEFLVVGVNLPFSPFEERRGENIVGFDIDIVKEIAETLGRGIIFRSFTEFDAVLPALKAEELDMVASAVTIRQDRSEIVDFSEPYYQGAQAVLAVKDSKFRGLTCPEDFTGIHIAYQEGTSSQFWVDDSLLDKIKFSGQTTFDDMNYGLQLLKLGLVDVIILDKPVAVDFVRSNPGLAVVGVVNTGEEYGFAVQQGDPQKILPVINRVLKEMRESGEYQKLIDKWFGGE